ncbi:hypothetical protein LTR62_005033 [Meristemomyces frigidus]|uniref:Uncharacterized protein n=1 Tax=Meristemomyces frigidus TaxID=1508187 RepID=A0AAN7TJ02_9PEZI|nr:hypothetical protein LTR62_005033 [Meristemomyces frigidus]
MTGQPRDHLEIQDSPAPDQPTDVNDPRSPQLDKVKCRCRCGCACACSRDGRGPTASSVVSEVEGAEGDESPGPATGVRLERGAPSTVDGQENMDDFFEAGDLGPTCYSAIHRALARRKQCTGICQLEDQTTPPISPAAWTSHHHSSSSSLHVPTTDQRSLSTVSLALSALSSVGSRSTSSSGFLPFIGHHLDVDLAHWGPGHYPQQLNIVAVDAGYGLGEYDFS